MEERDKRQSEAMHVQVMVGSHCDQQSMIARNHDLCRGQGKPETTPPAFLVIQSGIFPAALAGVRSPTTLPESMQHQTQHSLSFICTSSHFPHH